MKVGNTYLIKRPSEVTIYEVTCSEISEKYYKLHFVEGKSNCWTPKDEFVILEDLGNKVQNKMIDIINDLPNNTHGMYCNCIKCTDRNIYLMPKLYVQY